MEERPFGTWDSPLKPRDLASAARFRDLGWDGDGRTLVWLEERGLGGTLMCQNGVDAPKALNPNPPAQARVGYGGGEFAVSRGRLFFAGPEGRLWRQDLGTGGSRPLIPAFGDATAPCPSPDGHWVAYVHAAEDIDCIAIVDANGSTWPVKLATGADFYMQPTWHPRGKILAWIEWDHPHMPWDESRLVLGQLSFPKGTSPFLETTTIVAGGDTTAVFQPIFSPDGKTLAYVSDTSGWSNIWLYDMQNEHHNCLTQDGYDVGLPAWIQGIRTMSFAADGKRLYFTRAERGCRRAYWCELISGEVAPVSELAEYTFVEQLTAAPKGRRLACIASSSTVPPRIVCTDIHNLRICSRSSSETVPTEEFSQPEPLSWKAADGSEVYGLYYPPNNTRFSCKGVPPAVIAVHGGPASQAECRFEPRNQFFTTRGYALLDLNYRGSTGFGRAYVQSLRGNWGIYDVEDCFSGAKLLVDAGLADASRLIVMGGSAGGYTTLQALTVHPSFFKAGICSYGICNLFTLATDTHKFEAHYLDSLICPLPQESGLYRERSPIFSGDKIADPLILFQGTDDRVVPKEQAEELATSLSRRGVPHEYHLFEGEGHGWKKPETIEAYYLAIDAFLKKHVLFN